MLPIAVHAAFVVPLYYVRTCRLRSLPVTSTRLPNHGVDGVGARTDAADRGSKDAVDGSPQGVIWIESTIALSSALR